MRQCVAAINERRWYDQKHNKMLIEWQTKVLASFMAMSDEASKAVNGISIDPLSEEEVKKKSEPQPGSFENLMRFARGIGPRPH